MSESIYRIFIFFLAGPTAEYAQNTTSDVNVTTLQITCAKEEQHAVIHLCGLKVW